ncbi:hypothetical protein BKA70DRAFT_1444429 [Coprinopsis sp. MPI-PUGE-AT-0042]|nr:hypothetical protein BKA70DRAFT_1444429 [Coprinopsis sp. MPI-PUGE-AT-0042]
MPRKKQVAAGSSKFNEDKTLGLKNASAPSFPLVPLTPGALKTTIHPVPSTSVLSLLIHKAIMPQDIPT